MKRIQLIAAALCLVMLTTVGAGVVAAKAAPVAPQKVKQFDVFLYQGTETPIGKVIVNTNNWNYVVSAHGLSPGDYWLKCEGVPGVIATATLNAGGNLHMQGKLNPAPNVRTASPSFILGTGTPPLEAGEQYLDAKECADRLTTSFFGTLKDSSGTGVGGQAVHFYTYDPSTGEIQNPGQPAGTATTKSDGTFCHVFFGGHKGYDIVAFSGAAQDWNVEKTYSCPICN